MDAGNFFDEIDVALQIGTTARHTPEVFALGNQAKALQNSFCLGQLDAPAHQLIKTCGVQFDHAGEHGQFADHSAFAFDLTTGDFQNQLHRTCGRGQHALGIDAAFEAIGRITAEQMRPRSGADQSGCEIGRL